VLLPSPPRSSCTALSPAQEQNGARLQGSAARHDVLGIDDLQFHPARQIDAGRFLPHAERLIDGRPPGGDRGRIVRRRIWQASTTGCARGSPAAVVEDGIRSARICGWEVLKSRGRAARALMRASMPGSGALLSRPQHHPYGRDPRRRHHRLARALKTQRQPGDAGNCRARGVRDLIRPQDPNSDQIEDIQSAWSPAI